MFQDTKDPLWKISTSYILLSSLEEIRFINAYASFKSHFCFMKCHQDILMAMLYLQSGLIVHS